MNASVMWLVILLVLGPCDACCTPGSKITLPCHWWCGSTCPSDYSAELGCAGFLQGSLCAPGRQIKTCQCSNECSPPPPSPRKNKTLVQMPARAAAARLLAPFSVEYDPVVHLPTLFNAARHTPNCSAAISGITGTGEYGRLNNAIIELTHLLEIAATRPEPTLVVIPDSTRQLVPPEQFDYSFLKSWVCVTFKAPPGFNVSGYSMRSIYWWQRNPHGNVFGLSVRDVLPTTIDLAEVKGLILSQIILRPQPPLREAVERFLSKILNTSKAAGYVAIHLRTLEDSCVTVMGNLRGIGKEPLARQRVTASDMPGSRNVTDADICYMSDDYVAAALAKDNVPRDWPIVLAHDGQSPNSLLRRLVVRFGAVETKTRSQFADLLILVKSSYLIGNPASSFSANAQMIRSAMGASVKSSSLRAVDFPP